MGSFGVQCLFLGFEGSDYGFRGLRLTWGYGFRRVKVNWFHFKQTNGNSSFPQKNKRFRLACDFVTLEYVWRAITTQNVKHIDSCNENVLFKLC